MVDQQPTYAESRAARYGKAKRVVVKIGTSSLAKYDNSVNLEFIERICAEISELRSQGIEVVVVSSGSIGIGMGVMSFQERPQDIPTLQVCASCGQVVLIDAWSQALSRHGIIAGQVLFTRNDTSVRERYVNAKNTLLRLIALDAVPVINENDTVSTDEIKFGDNDTLAALATSMCEADLLVILSDVDGLYTADPTLDPSAKRIDEVFGVTGKILELARGSGSTVGTGGMRTKVRAAKILGTGGIPMVVCSANTPRALVDASLGYQVGTRFIAPDFHPKSKSKKLWIALGGRTSGSIVVDDGAQHALIEKGASLLPAGVSVVRGDFERNCPVDVFSQDGSLIARGLIAYSSKEMDLIRGMTLEMACRVLPEQNGVPVIHRDALMVF